MGNVSKESFAISKYSKGCDLSTPGTGFWDNLPSSASLTNFVIVPERWGIKTNTQHEERNRILEQMLQKIKKPWTLLTKK